jgi:hypothetical protein
MDLRGEEARRLLGEESFRLLQHFLNYADRETILKTAGELSLYAVKDEEGATLAEFEASPETAATVASLLTRAVETQKNKLAAWMISHSFSTGHGDTQEDLLKELGWQVEMLRTATEDENL